MTGTYRLRVDPWAADYDGAAGRLELDEPDAHVDATVEGEWRALRPAPRDGERPVLAFVDGVRRIDCRFVVEHGDQLAQGLFGSFAVGAATSNGSAAIVRETIGRVAATGSGFRIDPVSVQQRAVRATWLPEVAAEDDPDAPLRALQNAMRRAEAELAPQLLGSVEAVFGDGPLSSLAVDGPLIGYVKRLLRSYLAPAQQALLPRLEVGERTPLFVVRGAPIDRYSWYQRIGRGRAFDSAMAGVVRCECSVRLGLPRARELADLAARELPRFASDTLRDARAPQNLFPIGALETHLRHRLGDPLLLRRALEAQLAGTAAT